MTLEDWADDDFFAPVAGAAEDARSDDEEEERERARSIALLKRMEAPLTLWTIPEARACLLCVYVCRYRIVTAARRSNPSIQSSIHSFIHLFLWSRITHIPQVASSGSSVEEALARGERIATADDLEGTIVYGCA